MYFKPAENKNLLERILSHPIVLKCSRKNRNKTPQTQLCVMNVTLQCYMFRFRRNRRQAIHTKHYNTPAVQLFALYFGVFKGLV
jgi:hypothetical protein